MLVECNNETDKIMSILAQAPVCVFPDCGIVQAETKLRLFDHQPSAETRKDAAREQVAKY